MTVYLIANVGNSDLKDKDGNKKFGKEPRNAGKYYYKKLVIDKNRETISNLGKLNAPILEPAIDFVKKAHNSAPLKLLLLATAQNEKDLWNEWDDKQDIAGFLKKAITDPADNTRGDQQDTLFMAGIAKELLVKKGVLSSEDIEIYDFITANPADYGAMYNYCKEIITERIKPLLKTGDELYILTSGGVPASNAALLLNAIFYSLNPRQLAVNRYAKDDDNKVDIVPAPAMISDDIILKHIKKEIDPKRFNYAGALEQVKLLKTVSLKNELTALLEAADKKKKQMLKAARESAKKISAMDQETVEKLWPDNGKPKKYDVILKIQELFYVAERSWEAQDYYRFLMKTSTIIDLLPFLAAKKIGVSVDEFKNIFHNREKDGLDCFANKRNWPSEKINECILTPKEKRYPACNGCMLTSKIAGNDNIILPARINIFMLAGMEKERFLNLKKGKDGNRGYDKRKSKNKFVGKQYRTYRNGVIHDFEAVTKEKICKYLKEDIKDLNVVVTKKLNITWNIVFDEQPPIVFRQILTQLEVKLPAPDQNPYFTINRIINDTIDRSSAHD